jgi:hypothetical protein
MTQPLAQPDSQAVILALHTDLDTINTALSTNIGAGGLSEFDLPRIKMPAGGGLQWAVPALEGESMEPVIEGVIVLARDTRAYYAQPLSESGGGQPPDCWSGDGSSGRGHPGGACLACPLARWESVPGGRAQACKQIKQLFVLRGNLLLPEVISLPPTSLKAAKQYLLKLTAQAVPYYAVVTRLGLERTKNAQGIAYSRATFAFVRRLSEAERERARQYHEMLKPLVERMPVELEADAQRPEEAVPF